jgi:O-antigen ligase
VLTRTQLVDWLSIAAIPLIALCYFPWAQSPFLVPKAFLLALFAASLFALTPITFHLLPKACWLSVYLCLGVWILSSSGFSPGTVPAAVFAMSGPWLLFSTYRSLHEHFDTWQRWMTITNVAIASLVILQAFTPFTLLTSANGGRMRISGTLGNPLFAGVFLAAGLVVCVSLALRSRSLWARVAVALSVIAIAATGSRTALIAASAGVLVLFLRQPQWKRWIAIALIAALALLAAGKTNPRSGATAASGRLFIAKVVLHSGVTAMGSGMGSFAATYPAKLSAYFAYGQHTGEYQFAGYERHAHNDWVEILSETGVVGLMATIFLLLAWLWAVLRQPLDDHRLVALAIVTAILVAACADFPLHRAETWGLLWIAMGLALPAPTRPSKEYFRRISLVLACGLIFLALQPLRASRDLYLGTHAEGENDLLTAIIHYERALKFSPALSDAHFNLTRALCKAGRFDECWHQSENAKRFVDEAELYLIRVRLLAAKGDTSAANAELTRARERFPFSRVLREQPPF